MKRLTIYAAVAAALTLAAAPMGLADVPKLINLQGVLRDGAGNPVANATNPVVFRIYDAASGGVVLWNETQNVATNGGGLFSVLLGAGSPIADSVFKDTVTWLGIKVGSDNEMVPRQRLVSVGYSFGFAGWTISDSNLILADRLGGSVGIGEDNPQAKLDVAGDIHASGPITSGSTVTIDGATGTITSSGTTNRLLVLDADTVRIIGKATIGPGHTNTGTNAFVAGENSTASGSNATVGGGLQNSASGANATVGGGISNQASAPQATMGGGGLNVASSQDATVAGGISNIASGNIATTGGGAFNRARGDFSFVGGGGGNLPADSNSTLGDYSTIGGGRGNIVGVGGANATIGGGFFNIGNGTWATIGGGSSNTVSGSWATVGGGRTNTAGGTLATVSGGWENIASDQYATVGGGRGNSAIAFRATVGGGEANTASNNSATVGGGNFNTASGQDGTVGGGTGNIASGTASTVPGGFRNTALGHFSFAAGDQAKANHDGAFVWADATFADFASSTTNQFSVRASGGTRIFSNSALTAGVTLAAGASAWVAVSDSNLKRNIRVLDGKEVLEKVMQLPIKRWSYKAQDPKIEHIGPMAQDFYPLFRVGDDGKTISTIDPPGISLAAIQGLYQIVQEQKTENDELRGELKDLRELVQKLLAEKEERSAKTLTLTK